MKFSGSVDINRSIDVVTSLFANPEFLGEFQEGFLRKEQVSGVPGEAGAVAKMYYQYGKQEMELTETIKVNSLPDSFEAFYAHKHMDNTMKCVFKDLGNNRTRYSSEVEYIRINWVMPKLMAILFPSMYRKPAIRWMNNFKKFAESY